MLKETLTYRIFLQQEFERRCRKNPSYSLRAFARDLNVPAPKLCQALNGTRGMSAERALGIAKRIRLSASEAELFVSLVEAEHGRSQSVKTKAKETVESLQASAGFNPLNLELFGIIRDWYHFAILELTEVNGFVATPSSVSKRLKLTTAEVKSAFQKLLDFGLLKEDSKKGLVQTKQNLATPSGIPSREMREHHSQILQKADLALEETPVEERDFSAITMAIDSSQIEDARKAIKEFRRKFCKNIQESPSKDRVYCLAVQFFPLDQIENKKLKTEDVK